jgi:glycosyltransferase involved in cell wall biosynthesis
MWNGRRVSVVLPAFNEERSIRAAVNGFLDTRVVDEVIVVDNNSSDRTGEEVRQTPARLVSEPTQGYGAALQRGLREASGDYVVMAEPDGTFAPTDIFKLLAYAEDFDLVCGTRTTRELIWAEANMSWFLRVGNMIVAKMLEFTYNTPSLSDCGCTLRLVRRDALASFRDEFTVTDSHFLPEMVILARRHRLRIVEIPVNYRGRIGESKITGSLKGTIRTGLNMMRLIIAYRVARRR